MGRRRSTRVCTVEGCGRKHAGLGLCARHYQQKRCATEEYKAKHRARHRRQRQDPGYRYRETAKERNRLANFPVDLVEACRLEQGGKCAMPGCDKVLELSGRGSAGECADHDHATGRPRGLLCRVCNAHLGNFERLSGRAELYLCDTPVMRVEAKRAKAV